MDFDAWGDHPTETTGKEIVIFKHPTPECRAIKLEVEEDVLDLVPLPNDDMSISSSKSDNTSEATYCNLDNNVDDIVDYTTDLKNHSKLVHLIQTLTKVDKAIKKNLQIYSCEHELPDKLLVFAVTTCVENKTDKARKMSPEEPPTEAPLPEPPPTATAPPMQSQAPVLDNGEIGLPDMENTLYNQPIKVTECPQTSKPSKRDWEALCPLFENIQKFHSIT